MWPKKPRHLFGRADDPRFSSESRLSNAAFASYDHSLYQELSASRPSLGNRVSCVQPAVWDLGAEGDGLPSSTSHSFIEYHNNSIKDKNNSNTNINHSVTATVRTASALQRSLDLPSNHKSDSDTLSAFTANHQHYFDDSDIELALMSFPQPLPNLESERQISCTPRSRMSTNNKVPGSTTRKLMRSISSRKPT